MVAKATLQFPGLAFTVGDFFRPAQPDGTVHGILTFYCIVHLQPSQLVPAFSEMFRVLSPGGILLLSFHVGSETIRAENLLDSGTGLDFHLFSVSQVESAPMTAGYVEIEVNERQPYDAEHPTTRCYIVGCKP